MDARVRHGCSCIQEKLDPGFKKPRKDRSKCPSKSVVREPSRFMAALSYEGFFPPGTEASSLPIPTFDLISLTK